MPANICPQCGGPIASVDINMAEGVALCRGCGQLSRLGDVAMADVVGAAAAAPGAPPAGCWILDPAPGGGTELRAPIRSSTGGFFLLFTVFWNGFVSIFLFVAAVGLYSHLIGPLPSWMPDPKMSMNHGPSMPVSQMSAGNLTFLCLFLVPFVLVGIGTAVAALIGLLGSVRIRIDPGIVRVRIGLGPLGWTRSIDPAAIRHVAIGQTSWRQNTQTNWRQNSPTLPVIVIGADRDLRFGSGLSNDRRNWMLGVLREKLLGGGRGMGGAASPGRGQT